MVRVGLSIGTTSPRGCGGAGQSGVRNLRSLAWCHPLLVSLAVACGAGGGGSKRVSGTVTGAVTGGVTVTLACTHPVVKRTVLSDEHGRFAFDLVPEDTCTVTPSLAGYRFDPASTEVAAGPASQSAVDFAARFVLQVRGSDITAAGANIDVEHAGQVVDDAIVRVNGQVVPFVPGAGFYGAWLSDMLSPGDQVWLEVTSAGATVTGTGFLPDPPVLTWPGSGAYFSSGDDVVVTWTSATSPDSFAVDASWSCGDLCGTGATFEAPGSARSLTIPAGSLPLGEIGLSVFAYNDGALTGDYEAPEFHPGMNIRNDSAAITLTEGTAPGRTVSGAVTGAASSGVTVHLSCAGAADGTAITDDQGRYSFLVAPGVDCALTPECAGYAFDPPSATLSAASGSRTGVDFTTRLLLQVRGADITSDAACVDVRHAGQIVEDAIVGINGVDIPFQPDSGRYCGPLESWVSPGESISLEVIAEGATVTGLGLLPEAPVVTSPAADAQLTPGQDVVVTWTSATSPGRFLVAVKWSCGVSCGTGQFLPAPGSARTLVVPGALLPSGAMSLTVYAYDDGVLAGDYDPDMSDTLFHPGMNIRSGSDSVTVSR